MATSIRYAMFHLAVTTWIAGCASASVTPKQARVIDTPPTHGASTALETALTQVDEAAQSVTVMLVGPVRFPSGTAALSPAERRSLDRRIDLLDHVDATIVVVGYTDSIGSREENLALAQERADAVRNHLVAHGIDPTTIVAVGRGEDDPVASNDSRRGRQRNRRVALELQRPRYAEPID